MSMLPTTATAIASAVQRGEVSAREIVQAALDRIASDDHRVGAFTDVTAARALADADAVDTARRQGTAGPLAGVPYAVKNLFDIKGVVTRAGSKINRDRAPAAGDAVLIERLSAAGAILIGALNMGEYAYDFTGENSHDGPSRNPRDLTRMSGGSSGGSGAAVAAGFRAGGARVRHQRFDPRALVAVRHLRVEADLWPLVAHAHVSVLREPGPPGPVRDQRRRLVAGL